MTVRASTSWSVRPAGAGPLDGGADAGAVDGAGPDDAGGATDGASDAAAALGAAPAGAAGGYVQFGPAAAVGAHAARPAARRPPPVIAAPRRNPRRDSDESVTGTSRSPCSEGCRSPCGCASMGRIVGTEGRPRQVTIGLFWRAVRPDDPGPAGSRSDERPV